MGNSFSLNVPSGIPGVDRPDVSASPLAEQPTQATQANPETLQMATQAPNLADGTGAEPLAQRRSQQPVALTGDQQALVASAVLASQQLVDDPEIPSHAENLETVLRSFSHEPAHVQQAALDAVRKECPQVAAALVEHAQPGWWHWAGTLALRIVTLGLAGASAPQTPDVQTPVLPQDGQATPEAQEPEASAQEPEASAQEPASLPADAAPCAKSPAGSPEPTRHRCPNLQPLYRKIEADMQRAGSSADETHEGRWEDAASSQSDDDQAYDDAIPMPEGDFDAWLANVTAEPLDTANLGHPEAWGVAATAREKLLVDGLSWQGVYPAEWVGAEPKGWPWPGDLTASAQMLENMAWLTEAYDHAGRPGGLFDPAPSTAWEGLTGLTRRTLGVADQPSVATVADAAEVALEAPAVTVENEALPAQAEALPTQAALTAQDNQTLEQAIQGFCQFMNLHGTQLLTEKEAQAAVRLMTQAFAQQQKGQQEQQSQTGAVTPPDTGLQRLAKAEMSLEDFIALVQGHQAFWVAQPQVIDALKALRAKQKARAAAKGL